eukprot:331228-Ditylum_brightwellii.AAC.1
MEPEAAGSHLDTTIGAERTALKRMAEEFTRLQYHMRSMRIMVRKPVICGMDETRKIGSEDYFAGPFTKNLASP